MVKMILMVAEKPSIAEALARAISPTQQFSKRTGTSSKTPVYEFEGTFPYVGGGREKVWIKVTSTVGHVYKTEFPEKYRKWDGVEIQSLFDAPVEKLEADPRTRMPLHFQEEAAYCSHLVLWLDCDREGENICFEVMKNCCPDPSDKWNEARLIPRNNVHRAIFSALDEKSLREAYWELRQSPNQDLSDAVEARQEMDLKIGVAWTRFLTSHFASKYRDLEAKMLSYGPCQTPTLWFTVNRHDEITHFKPEKFHKVKVNIKLSSIMKKKKEALKMQDPRCELESSKAFKKKFDLYNTSYAKDPVSPCISMEWSRGAVFGEHIACSFKDMMLELCTGGEVSEGWLAAAEMKKGPASKDMTYKLQVLVTDVQTKTEERARPQGLDTVTMLKLASSQLGISPKDAMAKAEQLYLKGFVTYPRTESTAYPRSFDHKSVIAGQTRASKWGEYAQELLEKGFAKPRPGHDAGDHPPITPTAIPANRAETIADSSTVRLYELICRNYLASVSTNMRFQSKKVHFSISRYDETHENQKSTLKVEAPYFEKFDQPTLYFTLQDKHLIDAGYLKVQKKNYNDEEYRLEFAADNSPLNMVENMSLHERFIMEYCPYKDEKRYCESAGKVINNDLIFEVTEGMTKPPRYLTESELLGLMDKNGIGTDASMATHINTIVDRHYAEIGEGRRLIPTKLGIALVHGYQITDNELVIPKIRQDMEASCTCVAKGEAKRAAVVKHALDTFKTKFEYFEKNVEVMEKLWSEEFNLHKDKGEMDEEGNLIEGQEEDEEYDARNHPDFKGDKGKGKKGKKGDRDGKKGDRKGKGKDGEGKGKSREGDSGADAGGGAGGGWDRPERREKGDRDRKGKGKSGGGKGKGGGGDKGERGFNDPDLTIEDKDLMRDYLPPTVGQGPSAVFIKVNNKAEKEIQKLKKKLRDIEILEKKAEDGKKLDSLQDKKMAEKDDLMVELAKLEAK